MRAPAAMLLIESSQRLGSRQHVDHRAPAPTASWPDSPAGAFLCSDRVSIGKSLRCVSRFVSHRSHTKWNSGSRNRTDSE